MGRKRVYTDNADRQKAYRKRIIQSLHTTEWRLRSLRQLLNLAAHFGIEDEIRQKIRRGELTKREAFSQLRDRLAVEIGMAEEAEEAKEKRRRKWRKGKP